MILTIEELRACVALKRAELAAFEAHLRYGAACSSRSPHVRTFEADYDRTSRQALDRRDELLRLFRHTHPAASQLATTKDSTT